MNKLNFPKDVNAIAGLNELPNGKYTLHLSIPAKHKEAGKWIWSNDKCGYLFTADTTPNKVDGIIEAGIIVGAAEKTKGGRSILNDKGIDESFSVDKTAKRCSMLPL